jgi:hypothetical protein
MQRSAGVAFVEALQSPKVSPAELGGHRVEAGFAPIRKGRGCLQRAALAKCAVNREGKVRHFKGQSAEGWLVPNPSFERTPYSQLRWLPGAAQLER